MLDKKEKFGAIKFAVFSTLLSVIIKERFNGRGSFSLESCIIRNDRNEPL